MILWSTLHCHDQAGGGGGGGGGGGRGSCSVPWRGPGYTRLASYRD